MKPMKLLKPTKLLKPMKLLKPTKLLKLPMLFAGLLALGLLTHACQSEAGQCTPSSGDDSTPIEIEATMEGETATRAQDQDPVEITEGTLGLFRIQDEQYTALNDVKYIRPAEESWQSASPGKLIYVGASFAHLCAYAPYKAVSFANPAAPAEATLQAQRYAAAKDMSYATTGGERVWKGNPQATFVLQRAYARLVLAVSRLATYPTAYPCAITEFTLTPVLPGQIFAQSTLNISTGVRASGIGQTNYVHTVETAIKDGIATGVTDQNGIDLLLPPQTFANGVTLTLKVDGVNYISPLGSDKLPELVAGNRYIVTVHIGGGSIRASTVTIDRAWASSPLGDYETGF